MNTLIDLDTRVCDIVVHHPATVTVLNRFGIRLGVGDKTVGKICDEHHINACFFTTILNTFINKDYFPEKILDTFSAEEIVNYLSKTNAYYEHYQLPNIERHFQFLISKSVPQNNNLELMLKFFHEMKQELLNRIAYDRDHRFPELLTPSTGEQPGKECDEPDTIEDKIDDLISMIVIHLQGDYDANLSYAVLLAIISLKKDIMQNNRIRNRIMRPLHHAMSQQS